MTAIAAPRRGPRHRRVFAAVLAGRAVAASIALWAWARSPYGRWLRPWPLGGQNLPWRRRLSAPLGWAAVLAVTAP